MCDIEEVGESDPLNVNRIKNKSIDESENDCNNDNKKLVVIILALGNFCVAAGVSIQGPFFPSEAESKGASPMIYSSIFGVYELVMLLTSFSFGKIASKIAPNLMCGFGLAITGISTIVFGLLDHTPDGLLFIIPAFGLRIIESLGATAFATSSYSYITFKFPKMTATMFSIMETCFGLGLIVGPVIGGALYEWGGYTLPFLVLGILLTLSASTILIFISNKVNDNNCTENNNTEEKDLNVKTFIKNPIIILDSLIIITALSLIGFNAATLEPHLRQFSLKPLTTGFIFVTIGLMYAITAPIFGKLCDICNHNSFIFSILGSVLCIIGLVMIGPLPIFKFDTNLWLIIISLLLFGIGTAAKQVSGYSHALNYSIKNRKYPQNSSTYGLVSGLFFACISFGGFVGPTIGGFLIEICDYKIATIVILIIEISLLITIILSFLSNKTKIL